MQTADAWAVSEVGYVESLGTIGRKYGSESEPADVFRSEWSIVDAVALTDPTANLAAELMVTDGLRSLDAIHLASALSVGFDVTRFATWDKRLWQAAEQRGFQMLPAEL